MRKSAIYFTLSLALILSLCQTCCFATDTTTTWNSMLKTFNKKELKVEWINQPLAHNNIKNCEILDVRPDTSHLGMYSSNGSLGKTTILQFRDGFTLKEVFKTKLLKKEGGQTTVLMVVKDFWMNDQKTRGVDKDDMGRQEYHTSKVIFQLDVFVVQDEKYFPLVRVDSTIWNNKPISLTADLLFESALTAINNALIKALQSGTFQNRTAQTRETVFGNYLNFDPLKTIREKTPNKGVYYTYDQFKRNNPTPEHFKLMKDHNENFTLFLVDEKGMETLKRDVWGVYDSTGLYIMQDGLLFKLHREGKAFYWLGLKEYDQTSFNMPVVAPIGGNLNSLGIARVSTGLKIRMTPNLLNIATGKEY